MVSTMTSLSIKVSIRRLMLSAGRLTARRILLLLAVPPALRIVFGFRITQTGSFFILPLLPPLIITILANSILTGECDNSGRTTSLCARGIFHFPLLLIRTPMKKGPQQREKNQ